MSRIILLSVCILLAGGCAHVISDELRAGTDKDISLNELFRQPESYKGQTVILGGTIASLLNTEEGTYIEVVEKQLDYRGRPEDTDRSLGRFLILYEGYIDPAIYIRSRKVTVAGEVLGKKIRPLGEMNYRYPLIKSKELHLIKPGEKFPVFFEIGIWKSF